MPARRRRQPGGDVAGAVDGERMHELRCMYGRGRGQDGLEEIAASAEHVRRGGTLQHVLLRHLDELARRNGERTLKGRGLPGTTTVRPPNATGRRCSLRLRAYTGVRKRPGGAGGRGCGSSVAGAAHVVTSGGGNAPGMHTTRVGLARRGAVRMQG